MLQVIRSFRFYSRFFDGEESTQPHFDTIREHDISINTCQKEENYSDRKKILLIYDNVQIPGIEVFFFFLFSGYIYKQERVGQNIIYVCIAERQTAEINEPKERTNANVLVCVQYFFFFFFL